MNSTKNVFLALLLSMTLTSSNIGIRELYNLSPLSFAEEKGEVYEKENALFLKKQKDSFFTQTFFLRYFLAQYSHDLLWSSRLDARAISAKYLGELTFILASKAGLKTAKEYALPLYQKVLTDSEEVIRRHIGFSLGGLAKAFAWAGDFDGLVENVLPLYEKAFKQEADKQLHRGVARSLGELVEALEKVGNYKTVKDYALPLFEKALEDSDWGVQLEAAKHFDAFSAAAYREGGAPSVRDEIFPIYNSRSNLFSDERVLQSALQSFKPWIEVLLKEGEIDITVAQTFFYQASKNDLVDSNSIEKVKDFKSIINPEHSDYPDAIVGSLDFIKSFEPTVFSHQVGAFNLADEFLSRESFSQDMMANLFLGLYLVNPKSSQTLVDPTETWKVMIAILSRLKKAEERKKDYSYLSSLLYRALQHNSALIDEGLIRVLYKKYFSLDLLPKRGQSPKDLIALILLDFELFQLDLPSEYLTQIQKLKRGPGYRGLLPILPRLRDKDSIFREAIKRFSQWSGNIPSSKKGQYWGSVQKLLEISARDRYAFESLKLWDEVREALTLYKSNSKNKSKELQRSLKVVMELLPQRVGEVFHLAESSKDVLLDPKEIHVISYVAKEKDFSKKDHILNRALRPYFKARMEGKNQKEATFLYQENLKNLPELEKFIQNIDSSLLDDSGVGVKKIAPMTEEVVFKSFIKKEKLTQSFVKEATIYIEENPIEILHLGWPRLGKSCLDIVEGPCEREASGYLLHPLIEVVYIRDQNRPKKPLAEISVAFDTKQKALYLISPIKDNFPYEFRALVEKFLRKWATELGYVPFFPKELYEEGPLLSLSKNPEQMNLFLARGITDFFSDLTGDISHWKDHTSGLLSDWEEEIPGWVLPPLKEEELIGSSI